MTRRIQIEQTQDGTWQAVSDEGAILKFGRGEGLFSPVELMQIALAGCTALSGAYAVKQALGEHATGAMRVLVDGTFDPESAAFIRLEENVQVQGVDAKLDEEAARDLKERMERHITRGCTVKHTLEQGVPVRLSIDVRH